MKVYKIERGDEPPIYKSSKKELEAWCSRNPGEMKSYSQVDVLEELDSLSEDRHKFHTQIRESVESFQ